jgi:hypothetical protein
MTPYIVVWAAMAVAVLALAAWRQVIDMHEDDSIHLGDGQTALVTNQVTLAQKIKSIDRVGKLLTVVAALYGLGLCGWMVYQQWIGSMKL